VECGSCGHANPERAKFCLECGAPIALRCASCGTELPANARFCLECGTAVAPTTTKVKKQDRPLSYTPRHLAEKILTQRAALEGERKQVTVLFADVKGSMELAEALGAEAWHGVLDRFFEILTDGVHRFEGTVNQYTGDGIMALFGAPIAHEDHAQRACFAALALRDQLREFAREIKRSHGVDFATRIGLNSGEVIVGKIGDDLRMDYTAQGHTVGLAQRMEALASSGSIYLSEHTAALASVYFALEDLGEFTVKGATEPLRVFELQGTGSARTRFDLSRARGLVRFVGRDAEMQTLEAALERTRRNEGQVVGVVADAGTGKSRLCFEFAERARAAGVRVMEGRCVAHGRNLPLLPVLEVIRSYFGIEEGDDDRTAREKIAGRLLLLDDTYRDMLAILFEFLGVPDPERPGPEASAEARQRRLFALLHRLAKDGGATGDEVGLVLFEDLHWIDAASEAWIAEWVNSTLGSRTLLLLNFRPEYHADWMARAHYQQLALAPLSAEAIQELLVDLIGSHESTGGLAKRIHAHTGGNPFFAEEVVQTLIESGQLEGARGAYRLATPVERLEVPPTVQALLAARIDRLAEREKRVLQTASVIGKDFSEPLLAAVAELPERELADALAVLRNAEFVHEVSLYPLAEYTFKHPLTQEVALGSLLGERRRALHAGVAKAIEAGEEDLDEQAALLAHHWEAAGEVTPAARWHRRAAEWIAGRNAAEASHHWQRVRALADEIPDEALAHELGERSRLLIIELAWRRGISRKEADELLEEGEAWAERQGDSLARARLYNAVGIAIALGLGEVRRARKLLEEAHRLASEAGDTVLTFTIELRLTLVSEYQGDARAQRRAVDAANAYDAPAMAEASALVGYDAPSFVTALLGQAAADEGRLAEGLEDLDRGMEMARAAGATEVLGWVSSFAAHVALESGDLTRAARLARESREIAEQVESPVSRATSTHALARVLAAEGDHDAALAVAEQALEFCSRTSRSAVPEVLCVMAGIRCLQGDIEAARALASEALQTSEERGFQRGLLFAEVTLAQAALAAREPKVATRWIERAEDTANRSGIGRRRATLLELRAELQDQRGDAAGAATMLREAIRAHREMGAPRRAERIEADLAGG
jgi:class 3 adenylate cyclase/tetratricopeptide (TPR) repeat protein